MNFSIFIGEKRKEREKKKMGRKIAFTSACMLLTASCTGLQTNLDKDSSANPVVANTSQNDEVKVIIKKGNDTKKNKKSKENNDEIKNKIAKKHSEKEEDDSDYITTNINSNGLLDEKELVDEEMPNSRLVMQKLTELKMEQRKILSEGTSSQKKLWRCKINYCGHISNGKGQNMRLVEILQVESTVRHSLGESIGKCLALSCQDGQLTKLKRETMSQEAN